MEDRAPSNAAPRARPGRAVWALPVALALAFAGYHLWDLTLRIGGTGLALRIVDLDEARLQVEENDGATVLDIRLHGKPSPIARTLRMPSMELVRRLGELEPYKNAPLFVLAASDEEAAATAAFLARRDFNRVACIRVDAPTTAHARADAATRPLD